jgi:hypothetical protein
MAGYGEALKKLRENVDPAIDGATEDIDDKNRKELQENTPSR